MATYSNRYPVANPRDYPRVRPYDPSRRRPRNPRGPVWRPRPKVRPKTPLFPVRPRPFTPFGRRPPIPFSVPRGPVISIAGLGGRLFPIIGWALLAYDLWQLWQWYNQKTGMPLGDSGWIQCCADPSIFPIDSYAIGSLSALNSNPLACTATLCGLGGQLFNGNPADGIPGLTKTGSGRYNKQYLYLGKRNGAGTRQTHAEGYIRVVASPAYITPQTPASWPDWVPETIVPTGIPIPDPIADPDYVPFIPWFDPFLNPPLGPEPFPENPPVYRPPTQPYRPDMGDKGNELPTPDFKPDPRPNGETWPHRPPKGEKERKIKGGYNRIRQFLGQLLSGISEVNDVIEALWDALPESAQTEGANLREKFNDLYQNVDDIDMAEAVQNLVENQVEDKYLAQGFQALNEAYENLGIELGGLRD